VFGNNFVVAIKVNGKFIREDKEFVSLPFSTEFSIYLKNMNTRDALVKVEIDSADVLDGNSIILRANSFVELSGFMKGNSVTNKFKFIKMTEEISNFRGTKPEDGLIRVSYKFTKPVAEKYIYKEIVYPYIYYPYWHYDNQPYRIYGAITTTANTNDGYTTYTCVNAQDNKIGFVSTVNCNFSEIDGFTVKGQKTQQVFQSSYIGELEDNEYMIILKLIGEKNNKVVEKIVTTQDKKLCSTCGLKNDGDSSYCKRCGTYLE
jgi:hypothetical protein